MVLENDASSISVDESSDTSFKRTVTITGSAWTGMYRVYPSAEESMWAQKGYVHRVEVKDPFTGSWECSESLPIPLEWLREKSQGQITHSEHGNTSFDMSSYPEDDYVFGDTILRRTRLQ